jgi:hypothetical protein
LPLDSGLDSAGVISSSFLLLPRLRKTRTIMMMIRARPTTPPITPPTMAPVLEPPPIAEASTGDWATVGVGDWLTGAPEGTSATGGAPGDGIVTGDAIGAADGGGSVLSKSAAMKGPIT